MDQQIADLASAVILDPLGAARAAADAEVIADSVAATGLSRLAIARAEIWRVQQQRDRAPHELQPFLPDSDPVLGLTVAERTALALSLRLGLSAADVATVIGVKLPRAERLIASARRELARTAIAIGLLTNSSRCPVLAKIRANNEVLDRSKALQLVTHAAECSMCVRVMRVVDQQIVDDYRNAPRADLPAVEPGDASALVQRAQLQAGLPPRAGRDINWLRMAFGFGAASSLLLLLALFLGR